jgi:hypothetical protein
MKNKRISTLLLLLSASLITPMAYADNASKGDFDARIKQMDLQVEAERAAWEKTQTHEHGRAPGAG